MISIIIIVKNDRGIRDTLIALEAIEKPWSYEIIVVDASNGKLDDISKQFPNVKWIAYKNQKKKRITIPEQRNVGVLAASGEIVVFIDANCIPEDEWLLNLVKPIISQHESIVAGATLSRGKATTHDQQHSKNKNKQYINEIGTGNLAFTRKLYEKVGGFDESFDYGSDTDFTWRVIDMNYKLRYKPDAIIRHDWGSTNVELNRSFRYGKARARLHIKHKNRRRYLMKHDIVVWAYPTYILLLPVTIIIPWYPALLLIPTVKNYKKRPVKTLVNNFVFGGGVIYEVLGQTAKKLGVGNYA